jgi:multidrug efflux pump subunit AcrA (membrane-fusion protein)
MDMFRSRKLWIAITLLAAISLLAACLAQPNGSSPAGAVAVGDSATGKVTEMEYAETVEASGALQADQFATLAWKISGTVAQVDVEVGDIVKTGDALMTLDPVSAPANVISASSDLLTAQQSLDDLRNSKLPQAQALQALEQAQQAIDDRELNLEANQAQVMLALIDAGEGALEQAAKLFDQHGKDETLSVKTEGSEILAPGSKVF